MQTLRTWLDALPEEVWRARAGLCLVQAWLVVDLHTADRVAAYVSDAEEALRRAAPTDDTRDVRGELATTKAVVAALHGDSAAVVERAQEALAVLDHDNSLMRGVAYATLGSAYVGQGDLARAAQTLGDATAAARAAQNVTMALAMTEDYSYVQRARGLLHQAVTACREALAWSAGHGGEPALFASGSLPQPGRSAARVERAGRGDAPGRGRPGARRSARSL